MKNIWFAIFWIMIGFSMAYIFGNFQAKNSDSSSNNIESQTQTVKGVQNNNQPQEIKSTKTTIDDDPYLGDKEKAKVAIVEFSDYECPFCKKFHQETFDQIVKNYVDTGKAIIVYRDFPLSFHEPAASTDASAANCVQEISGNIKYFEMMRQIFDRGGLNGVGISKEKFIGFGEEIGTDKNEFAKCLDADKFQEEIQKDLADGQTAGIDGTPGFVIGKLSFTGEVSGELISGAQPFSVFQEVIERQLKK